VYNEFVTHDVQELLDEDVHDEQLVAQGEHVVFDEL